MPASNNQIDYSKRFLKQRRKAPYEIKIAFHKRFNLFLTDPFHPLLDNHALTGQFAGYRSINITGDWRAIFTHQTNAHGNTIIVFYLLGTHSQLYR